MLQKSSGKNMDVIAMNGLRGEEATVCCTERRFKGWILPILAPVGVVANKGENRKRLR